MHSSSAFFLVLALVGSTVCGLAEDDDAIEIAETVKYINREIARARAEPVWAKRQADQAAAYTGVFRDNLQQHRNNITRGGFGKSRARLKQYLTSLDFINDHALAFTGGGSCESSDNNSGNCHESSRKTESHWHYPKYTSTVTSHSTSRKQGIVTCAGGKTYVLNLVVMLRVLRLYLKSSLPVEVFYWGKDDLNSETVQWLSTRPDRFGDVVVVDASRLPVPFHRAAPFGSTTWKKEQMTTQSEEAPLHQHEDESSVYMRGFALKAYALLHTSFDLVLFLDADSTPVVDPSFLFDAADPRAAQAFFDSGCLFWPDLQPLGAYPYTDPATVYKLFSQAGPPGFPSDPNLTLSAHQVNVRAPEDLLLLQAVDSGQFLIDRRRLGVVAALEWLWFLNHDPPLRDLFLQGDKDSFRIAWTFAEASIEELRRAAAPLSMEAAAWSSSFAHVAIPARGGIVGPKNVSFEATPGESTQAYHGLGWRLVAMVQSHPTEGWPLFLHRTQSKLNFFSGFNRLTHISSPLRRRFMLREFGGERSVPAFSFRMDAFQKNRVSPPQQQEEPSDRFDKDEKTEQQEGYEERTCTKWSHASSSLSDSSWQQLVMGSSSSWWWSHMLDGTNSDERLPEALLTHVFTPQPLIEHRTASQLQSSHRTSYEEPMPIVEAPEIFSSGEGVVQGIALAPDTADVSETDSSSSSSLTCMAPPYLEYRRTRFSGSGGSYAHGAGGDVAVLWSLRNDIKRHPQGSPDDLSPIEPHRRDFPQLARQQEVCELAFMEVYMEIKNGGDAKLAFASLPSLSRYDSLINRLSASKN